MTQLQSSLIRPRDQFTVIIRMARLLIWAVLVHVHLYASPLQATSCNFSEITASIEALLDDYPSLPGAGLLIGGDEKVVYEAYFANYDANTVVPLASASKLLSAVLIMDLVDDQLIDLDRPVGQYLPEFNGEKAQITTRQMFSHTAGLAPNRELSNPFGPAILSAANPISLAESVEILACCEPLIASPGTEFAYGGASMHIAGRVAEVVTGTDWETLFQQRISEPLGITSIDYQGLGTTRNYRPAGGARSTMSDYGKVLKMLLGKGLSGTQRVLSEAAVSEMMQNQTRNTRTYYRPPQSLSADYGLGTWIESVSDAGETTLFSSPGAFSFTPWLDLKSNYYGVLMLEDRSRLFLAERIRSLQQQISALLMQNQCHQNADLLTKETGIWFDRAHPGHGMDLQAFGDQYAGPFYSFDQQGQPQWFWMDGRREGDSLSGHFLKFTNVGNSEQIETQSEIIGEFELDFAAEQVCDDDVARPDARFLARFSWDLDNESGSWCMEPLLTVNDREKSNTNGIWWGGPQESGWGFGLYANNELEFRIIYLYDSAGNPSWVSGQSQTNSEVFNLSQANGYCRSCQIQELDFTSVGFISGVIDAIEHGPGQSAIVDLMIDNLQLRWEKVQLTTMILSNPAY